MVPKQNTPVISMISFKIELKHHITLHSVGALHNCQHLNEYTKHTLSHTPSTSKSLHTHPLFSNR